MQHISQKYGSFVQRYYEATAEIEAKYATKIEKAMGEVQRLEERRQAKGPAVGVRREASTKRVALVLGRNGDGKRKAPRSTVKSILRGG
nr:hypothetical protein [Corynebacterium lactis]